MAENTIHSIESYVDPEKKERRNWAAFVEGAVVAFFDANEIEKLTIEDGEGNRAKLTRMRENIKIEYTSSVIL